MTAEIRVLTGARAGLVLVLTGKTVVGRAVDATLRFDPDLDLQVSARHAVIDVDAEGWHLRDEGSRNGTFVNGQRVSSARLNDGDHVTFGPDGPEVEFRSSVHTSPTQTRDSGVPARVRARSRLARQNLWLLRLSFILGAALIGSIIVALWSTSRDRASWATERRELLDRIDSVLTAGSASLRALAGEQRELAEALTRSQAEVQRVRRALESAGRNDSAQVAELRRQLQSAVAAITRQQMAASLDHEAVERAIRRAVAVVWVETGDGVVVTGTAFAVGTDATLITVRHVLASANGEVRPRRVAVQFSDSHQVWPARVLRWSEEGDLAVIKVDNITGGLHPAPPFNLRPDTLGPGAPIAWIGFPLGGETWPQDPQTGRLARPLLSVGVLTAMDLDVVEVQGYGASGASGSPILDANGQIIAVLSGRQATDGRHLLLGVPAIKATRLLEAIH